MQGGVAKFSGLNDQTAGTIRLVFLSGSLVSPASSPIVVSPGAAAALAIQIQPYASVTAGTPLTDPIDVAEVDQYGNVVASDNATQVTAALASGSGKLIGTKQVTVQGGIASFDDLEDDAAGSLTLRFSAGTLASVVSSPSVVQPAKASQLAVTLPPGGIMSGTGFPLEVDALDPYGNVDSTFNGPVTLSSTDGNLSGTLAATASDGVARFTDVVSTTIGNIAVTAKSSGLTPGTSSSVPVGPAPPSKLVIQVEPPQAATAGQAFATTAQPVAVYEENPYGDLAIERQQHDGDGVPRQRRRHARGDAHRHAGRRRGHVHQPLRQHRRDVALGFTGRIRFAGERPDRRQPGGGQPVGHPDPALIDGDGRPGVRDPAGRLRGGRVRQPRDDR